MRIVLTPEHEMLRNHERYAVRQRLDATAPKSQVIGTTEAARLLDRREFVFRGRPYRVPPVPWPLAAEILGVQDRIRVLASGGDTAAVLEAFGQAASLSRRACYPAGWFRRLLWPITPNPFRRATPWEVGRHLGFFSTCLALDGAAFGMPGNDPARGTSGPISPASSRTSPPGSVRTASRSPGATS